MECRDGFALFIKEGCAILWMFPSMCTPQSYPFSCCGVNLWSVVHSVSFEVDSVVLIYCRNVSV